MFARPQEPVIESTQSRADHGDAGAQFQLGLHLASAEGAAQDYTQAMHWYHKAADQSHTMAQFNLGMMYARGQGVPQNDATSAMWILKAACLGDAGAQFALGVKQLRKTFDGASNEVNESKVEAYKWLHLATTQGYRGSEDALNSLIFRMTHESVMEGNHRVAGFLAERASERKGASSSVRNVQGTAN